MIRYPQDSLYAPNTIQSIRLLTISITMHIILLSGPVASGKSTLCRALERRFGMTVLQTRELITRSLDRKGALDRKNLQWEGERLDRETGGAWIRDELKQVLNERVAEGTLAIDAVRTLEQVRIIRDTYDSAVSHIHLTAPEQTLSVRYATRSSGNGWLELPAYALVRQNETERMVDTLRADADIVINTGLNDEVETFGAACIFLFRVQHDRAFR